jgi:hypothetical protein
VYFTPENAQDPLSITLMTFYELDKEDQEVRTILYFDSLKYYTWKFCSKQEENVRTYPVMSSDTLARVYMYYSLKQL